MTGAYNQRWTAEDDRVLITLLDQGMHVLQIAERIGRTEAAVYWRKSHLTAHVREAAKALEAVPADPGVTRPAVPAVVKIKRGPVLPPSSIIKPPTREQLMGRR